VSDYDPLALNAQLAALAAGPKIRWRRFRQLEVVCAGCGDLLIEVMGTQPPVILTRTPTASHYYPLAGDGAKMLTASCRCQTVPFTRTDLHHHLDRGASKVIHPAKFNTVR
jgi:hypothetical protein